MSSNQHNCSTSLTFFGVPPLVASYFVGFVMMVTWGVVYCLHDLTGSNDKTSKWMNRPPPRLHECNTHHGGHFMNYIFVREYIARIFPLQNLYRQTTKTTIHTVHTQCPHIVPFIGHTAMLQQKAWHLCMAFHCSSKKWSVAPLRMKWGKCSGICDDILYRNKWVSLASNYTQEHILNWQLPKFTVKSETSQDNWIKIFIEQIVIKIVIKYSKWS